MSLAVAIQMDPIENINIETDSSFMLLLEGQKRGHALFYYQPQHLAFKNGRALARIRPIKVARQKGKHYELGVESLIDLATMDVVLMRQDPPFDLAYITTTHILERIHPRTLVINDPIEVRNAPEKLLVTKFNKLIPPTLISADKEQILAFRNEMKDVILKPLFGNGGAGVFHITKDDDNINALLELFTQLYREPIIVQKYLPEVRGGDKRIILVNGKAVGAINRVPAKGETRSNLHVGGQAVKADLTERDHEICDSIGATLESKGLLFVGIDVIGDYLTEINVTSPTGIQEINHFNQTHIEAKIWDAIETKRALTTNTPSV